MDVSPLLIRGARVVDPVAGIDGTADILLRDRKVAELGGGLDGAGAEVVDGSGLVAAPGLIDAGVFRPDPAASLAGGITRVVLMPDQSPPLDDPAVIDRAQRIGKPHVWVHPLAAATRGLEGHDLAEIGLMREAGAVGVATGRHAIPATDTMYRLLQYAAGFDLVTVTHAEDPALAGPAAATNGETATRLGLPAAPPIAEALAVARDIRLAEATGARLHIRIVSLAESLEIVRRAKDRGVRVTCGTTPAHALLNDGEMSGYRTFARLSPPLRSDDDRKAIVEGLCDGTIDVLSSGHDPRTIEEKRLPFALAAPGVAGLETLLPLALAAVREKAGLARVIELISAAPARIFGLPGGSLAKGGPADVTLFSADEAWRIDANRFGHAAGNTPFDRLPVAGRVKMTIKGGEAVYRSD